MLTTCPECHTTFRISQAQLDRRRGLVRCGRCSAVFNAYDTLLPELQTPAEAATAATMAAEGGAGQMPPGAEPFAPASASPPATPLVEDAKADAQPPGPETREPASPKPETSDTPSPPETPESILLAELPRRRPTEGLSRLLWSLASTILALAFGLQLVYFLRAEIAQAWPQSRPLLVQACARLGCDLPLPEDAAAVRIDASALETDPEDASRAVLTLTLSNRSAQTVAWPHLVLTLTDTRDAPVAQRPFAPAEYLAGHADVARGMPPGTEQEVRLDLELKGLLAYGYKLDKRYP